MFIGNDDDYEDVFSNVYDSNVTDLKNKISSNKKPNKKSKNAYFHNAL